MNNAKIKYKNNYQPLLMEPLPVVEQLNSAYRSSDTKRQMLNTVLNGQTLSTNGAH